MKGWLGNIIPSPKTIAKAQIFIAAISAVCLGMATWITTLQIPKIEENIDIEDSRIKELRYQITKDLVQGLYAMDVYTERRIDFLDIRLESIMVSGRSNREQQLLEGTIQKTINQIKQWDLLFKGEQTQLGITTLPIFDSNIPAEHKIIKLDETLTLARRNAYSRLEQIIKQIHVHELQKGQYQNIMKRKQTIFMFFQMIGLLALIIGVALEARKELKEVVT